MEILVRLKREGPLYKVYEGLTWSTAQEMVHEFNAMSQHLGMQAQAMALPSGLNPGYDWFV